MTEFANLNDMTSKSDYPADESKKVADPMKVFISYAHAQSRVVEDIVKALEDRGHEVWFDKENIDHGDDWREKITKGLQESNGVLSFLSREAIREGGVCLDELGIAVGVKYGNIRTVLLQKEKDLQPVPSQLTHRQWLDMSDWQDKLAEGEDVYRAWLAEKLAVILQMIESDESREFMGDISFIREKLDIEDSAVSRQAWYLRQPFVGRKWLTEKLENWLNDPDGGHLCAVYGGPGTGKSAFAAQYVYRSPRAAASLFFEHGNTYFNSPDAIVRELIFQLACRLPSYRSLLIGELRKLSGSHALNTQELFEQLFAYPIQHAVNGGMETLCVVVDGLDECEEDGKRLAAQLLSEEKFPAWLRVVVLTRPENTVTASLKPDMEIRMEEDENANRADIREYFSLRLGKQLAEQSDKDALLDRLTANADGVFLYAYIVTDMILRGKLDLAKPDEYPKNLNDSFEKWFSRYFPDADEYDRLYKLPLGILAACAEPVPVEELDALNARYDPDEESFVLTEPDPNARRQSVVKRLERCAVLLKYDQNEFGKRTVAFTHRYIGEWMTKTDEKTGQSASRTYFCAPADACWVLSASWRGKLERREELTDYQALNLLEIMRRAGEDEGVIKEIASNKAWDQLLNRRYDQYDTEGRWKLCLPFAQAKVELCRCAYGAEDPETLTALSNLAVTYGNLGRHEDALKMQEQVYALRRHVLGEEHPDTLGIMNNLAYTYGNLGRYKEALKMQEQIYELSRRVLGEEHPFTLTALNNLAGTYGELGRRDDALKMQEQVYTLSRRVLGEEHPGTLTTMNNLACTYGNLGRYKEALKMQEQVYALSRRVLGEEHPDTLTAMGNLAYAYSDLGRYEDALKMFEQVYALRRRVLGEEHPDTLTVMNNLAYTYSNLGRHEDALKILEQVFALSRRVLGDEHPDTLTAMNNLAVTYGDLGHHEDALKMQEEVFSLSKYVLGDEHPNTLRAMNNLACTYSDLGHHADALKMQEQVDALYSRILRKRVEQFLEEASAAGQNPADPK